MLKEFVLVALMQVPTYVPEEPSTYELRPVSYHETMRECLLSRRVKLVTKEAPSYECMRRDFR